MHITLAPLPITPHPAKNLERMLRVIDQVQAAAAAAAWIVFPEGMLSGYQPEDPAYVQALDGAQIAGHIETLRRAAADARATLVFGTAFPAHRVWYNAAVILSPARARIYCKVNLDVAERAHFVPGGALSVVTVGGVALGVQLCRELIFPEQWKALKHKGARIIFHLNHARKPDDARWRHVLISRALENQVYVVSVNCTPAPLASYIVAPDGTVLLQTRTLAARDLDMTRVTDYYLSQERTDLVKLIYPK